MINGQRWTASGANVYWLGLDENVHPPKGQPFYAKYNASYPTFGRITEAMNILNTMGARAIRSQTLGISVGNPLSLEPELGKFNDKAFDTIDYAIYQAREHGLRIMMPLIDNYDYYHGGKFVFLRWRGINLNTTGGYSKFDPIVQQFYLNDTIVNDFKAYIKHLITHVNPHTGLTYADDPTVFAFETGNELGGPIFGDMDVPNSWTSDIASFVKGLAPRKLVVDGTYGINKTHLTLSEVDIYSDHFYPLNTTKLSTGIDEVRAANKTYLAGEYDWTGTQIVKPPAPASLESFYAVIEEAQTQPKATVAGDLFWSLFGHDYPNCCSTATHRIPSSTTLRSVNSGSTSGRCKESWMWDRIFLLYHVLVRWLNTLLLDLG